MREALADIVFRLGDDAYSWRDSVHAAALRGEWREVEERARRGAALEKRARARGGGLAPVELERAANELRYARGLLTAREAEAWLAARHLDVDAWLAALERSLLLERSDPDPDLLMCYPVGDAEVERLLWADTRLSGALERAARALAVRVAVAAAGADEAASAAGEGRSAAGAEGPCSAHAPRLPEPPASALAAARVRAAECLWGREAATEARTAELVALELVFTRWRQQALVPERVERAVTVHRLPWTRVCARRLRLRDCASAREALLAVREDGTSLEEAGALAGVAVEPVAALLEDLSPALREALTSARAGELLGPFEAEGAFELLALDAKELPSTADPEVRRRAEARVLEAIVAFEVARSVRFERQAL